MNAESGEFREDWLRHPGLIPTAIDVDRGRMSWSDLGSYHFYESEFQESVETFAALHGGIYRRESRLEVLDDVGFEESAVTLKGFVFHAGRCGSTLLARVLGRSRAHLLFSEPPVHNHYFRLPSQSRNPGTFRNLTFAMARKRLPNHVAAVVKFTSYNILRFAEIRAAFPDTPALFLVREPAAVLASLFRGPPTWFGIDIGIGRQWASAEEALAALLRSAADTSDAGFRVMDYSMLTPETLPKILGYFGLRPPTQDLEAMTHEFGQYSKRGHRNQAFHEATPSSGRAVPAEINELYASLRDRARSDWP